MHAFQLSRHIRNRTFEHTSSSAHGFMIIFAELFSAMRKESKIEENFRKTIRSCCVTMYTRGALGEDTNGAQLSLRFIAIESH